MLANEKLSEGVNDVNLWRRRSGYDKKFSTHETWSLLRTSVECCRWSNAIWFSQATPKYAFVAWLAVRYRLATIDRISKWR